MNNTAWIPKIADELALAQYQVNAVVSLLDEDATIPFIARYRKEVTGSLDEVQVTAIRDRRNQLKDLDDRRAVILKSLEKHGHLTDELREKVQAAAKMTELEDIYLPYKPKRRTRGVMAREKGLEPLALILWEQKEDDPKTAAEPFVDPENGVESVDDALAGARDIIAEMVNEDEAARARIRELFLNKGEIRCRVIPGLEEDGKKFRDYFDWQEPVASVPSHRMLAMRRGEAEGMLMLDVAPDKDMALGILREQFVRGTGAASEQVDLAVTDSYQRLLSTAMETETRLTAKKRAEADAIAVFAENLRQLLLSPPLGAKRVMGIDPGFRTGCKVVCLDRQGALLHTDTIYPHTSPNKADKEAEKIRSLCETYAVEAIAVGNGTAGRATESFIRAASLPSSIAVVMVNESGASVYSASDIARQEFPDHDLTVRGAVSIGRRLMDPLAELVKIDPKAIGVGQYQHDVNQTGLKQALDDVVISCVNRVGVDVNRASAQLLGYVSGLNTTIAQNIVQHRETNGPFASRRKFLDVPRLGPKAFEQSAGFLRISGAENPLDASAVHPESYHIVEAMAADLDATVADLTTRPDLRSKIDLARYVSDTVGEPTLKDILNELAKPGRDPRETFEPFAFAAGIEKIDDVRPGMRLPGIVTNITAFGAFVDIGVHQDGLVHISEMADRFVKNPSDVVKLGQAVTVRVLEVDIDRKRISLSMKSPDSEKSTDDRSQKNMPKKNKIHGKAGHSGNRAKGKSGAGKGQSASQQGTLAAALKKSGLNIP